MANLPTTTQATSSHPALYDQMPKNYTPSEAGRSTNDGAASDAASVYSYESTRDLKHFLREMQGRTFNAQNEVYLLPSGQSSFLIILQPFLT